MPPDAAAPKAENEVKPPDLPLASAKCGAFKKPSSKGKAELVSSEKHGEWMYYKYKRSTSGLPFNKYVGPNGKTYWTNHAAKEAGFKNMK